MQFGSLWKFCSGVCGNSIREFAEICQRFDVWGNEGSELIDTGTPSEARQN